MVTDSTGVPLNAVLTAGQAHGSTQLEAVLDPIRIRGIRGRRGRPRRRPRRVAGDKAYHVPRIRRHLRRRGIKAVIPVKAGASGRRPRRGRPVQPDRQAYRRRNAVERCFGWLKRLRRIGTRHEKTARRFMAMLKLAMMRQCMKVLLRDTTYAPGANTSCTRALFPLVPSA